MDRMMGYGLVGTVGVSASTMASAAAGDPMPVVLPAVVAGVAIAGHHLRRRREQHVEEPDEQDDPLGMFDEEGA